jgi:hypothetical protein
MTHEETIELIKGRIRARLDAIEIVVREFRDGLEEHMKEGDEFLPRLSVLLQSHAIRIDDLLAGYDVTQP